MFTVRPSAARVGLNGIAKFDCVAQGNPPPSVFWAKEVSTVETNMKIHLNNFAMASSPHQWMYCVKENHTKQTECTMADIQIHPILGTPTNICVTLPASDPKYLNKLQLGEMYYKVKLLIVNSESEVVFALYQNEIAEM